MLRLLRFPRLPVGVAFGLATLGGGLAASAGASEAVWIGSSNGVWSQGTNWLGGTAPASGGAADFDLRFRPPGGVLQATNDLGPFVLRSLHFQAPRGFGLGLVNYTGNQVGSVSMLTLLGAAPDAALLQLGGGDVRLRAPLDLPGDLLLGGGGLGVLSLTGPISGAGAIRLERAEGGVTLLGNPDSASGFTFTGGVDLLSGRFLFDEASALGTGTLRASGGSFGVNYYGGPRNLAVGNALVLSNFVSLGGGAGFTFSGPISGSGVFTLEPTSNGQPPTQIRFQSSAAYTGDLVVQVAVPGLTVFHGAAGGFPLASSVSVQRGATLEVDDRPAAASADRLPDAAPLALTGGATLIYRSGTGRASVENFGAFRPGGWGQVSLNPDSTDTASSARLVAASWQPAPGGVTVFSGRNLGQNAPGTPGSDSFLVADPTAILASLRGAGGLQSILPQAVANYPSFNNYGFATYDQAQGVRLANFGSTLTNGSQTLNNVRISDPVVLDQPTTINALALDVVFGPSSPRIGRVSGTGTLTVAGGVVLMGPRASELSVATVDLGLSGALLTTSTFQASQVGSPSPATISSRLLAGGGLTIAGSGAITLSGDNLIDGRLVIAAPVSAGSANALGGTGPLEIQGGTLSTAFDITRDVIVTTGGGWVSAPRLLGALGGRGELRLGGDLFGPATFTGPTTLLFGGRLGMKHSSAVGNAGLRAITNTMGGNATLEALVPVTLTQPLEVDGAGNFTVVATAALTVPRLAAVNGGLGPSANFSKQGAADLTILGDLNLRGALTVSAGGLYVHGQIAAPGAASSNTFTVNAGGLFGGSAVVFRDVTVAGQLTGPVTLHGGLIVQSGGLVRHSGAGTLTVQGGAITNQGTMRFSNGAVFAAGGAVSLTNNGVLDLISAGPGTTLPPVVGSGVVLTASSVRVKSVARAGGFAVVTIDSHDGHIYSLQRSESLAASEFQRVRGSPAQNGATGTTLTFTDPNPPPGEVFYRVAVD